MCVGCFVLRDVACAWVEEFINAERKSGGVDLVSACFGDWRRVADWGRRKRESVGNIALFSMNYVKSCMVQIVYMSKYYVY